MLLKRSNIYYFRWQIPADLRGLLGVREIVKSLRTNSKSIALVSAAPLFSIVDKTKDARRRYMLKELTDSNYLSVMAEIRADFESKGIRLEGRSHELADNKLMIKAASLKLQDVELPKEELPKNRGFGQYTGVAMADWLLSDENIEEQLNQYGYEIKTKKILDRFRRDFAKIQLDHEQRAVGFLSGETEVVEMHRAQPVQVPVAVTSETPSVQPLLSEVFEELIQYKRESVDLDKKRVGELRRGKVVMCELVGDAPVDTYTRKDFRDAIQTFIRSPLRTKNPYKKMSLRDALFFRDVPLKDQQSKKNTIELRKCVRAAFNFAVDREYIATSPCEDLPIDTKKEERRRGNFTDNQINLLLAGVMQCEGWEKWLMLLGVYTGARRGELMKLRGQDIRVDEVSGRYYISINTDEGAVKTKAAIRRIPVHHQLIKLGFLDVVSDGRLFPDCTDSKADRWFNLIRDTAGIPKYSDEGEVGEFSLTYHSLRHTFITKATSQVALELLQQVVGHKLVKSTITTRYQHTQPLEVVCSVVDCIDWG